jgi:hypothetical protein
LGFRKCKSEHDLYTKVKSNQRLIVRVYVDDLIIMGESTKEMSLIKEEMKSIFRISDLGVLSYYLGIEVRQDERGISLSERAYAAKLLEKIGMMNCNPCAVPMDAKLKLSKEGNSSLVDPMEYRGLIGSLRYLLHARHELTFSVNYLNRFMEKPRHEHMAVIKHLLRYVAGTLEYDLFSPRGSGGSFGVLGYSDNDLAGDADENKSTSGMIFFLGDNCDVPPLSKDGQS